jgi:hypothetical protein
MPRRLAVAALILSIAAGGCGDSTSDQGTSTSSSDDNYVSICTEDWPISEPDCQQIVRASRVCPDSDRNDFLMTAQGAYAFDDYALSEAIDNAEAIACPPGNAANPSPTVTTTTEVPPTTTAAPTTTETQTTTTRAATTTTRAPTTTITENPADFDVEAQRWFMELCVDVNALPDEEALTACYDATVSIARFQDLGQDLGCLIDAYLWYFAPNRPPDFDLIDEVFGC